MSGSAYLFNVATGEQIAKLLAEDGAAGDQFGLSVGISGNTAIIGALGNDNFGGNSGSAYLFDARSGEQITKLLPDDAAAGDQFGSAVAIDGSVAVVGAARDDDSGENSGSAYVFNIHTGRQLTKLLPCDGAEEDRFGASTVAIGDDIAIVGAVQEREVGEHIGSAYLFDITTGRQIAKVVASDSIDLFEGFGWAAAIDGPIAIIGSPWDSDQGFTSGSTYVVDATVPCNADFSGDGVVGPDDLALLLGSWGRCRGTACEGACPADLSGDQVIAADDLAIMLGYWGPCQ